MKRSGGPRLVIDSGALNKVYVPHLRNFHRYQLFFGGSSSGKSVFLATRAVLDCMQGRNYLVTRNVARTIRGSCWNEIQKAISRMGLGKYFSIGKSEFTITCRLNGAQILFAGLDDVEKIKSITPANGPLTDIWMEEATECEYGDLKQLDKRLRGSSTHIKRMTLSFNPVYKEHWIYRNFFGIWDDTGRYAESGDVSILKTTYRDNRFLTSDDRRALEEETDPYYKDVYTDGNWGTLGDVIFRNWHVEDLSPIRDAWPYRYYGLDFGFSSDPCGFVDCALDKKHERIYVFGELCERGLTNQALAREIKARWPEADITCDSAEPKSIQELRNQGIRAYAAVKGPDSVHFGIQWLKRHEIIIDRSCRHLKEELTLYKWRQDKNGNAMKVPEDKNNHLIDALRYALEAESLERKVTTSN